MKNIQIVGAGQLGSRHLQALSLVEQPLSIEVIDPNPDSLAVAQQRYESMPDATRHQVTYSLQAGTGKQWDVVINASSAKHRAAIIDTLLKNNEVKHLVLEKLLFCQEKDYASTQALIEKQQTHAWVNCCMRMMPFYQQLSTQFSGQAIQFFLTGGQYGLVTNAIHYLDYMVYLTGCQEFTLDTYYLDKAVTDSKRSGYLELTGTLMAKFANGSLGHITCDKNGQAPIQIDIRSQQQHVVSYEWLQKANIAGADNQWQWCEQAANIPYQSEMTAKLVNDLLTQDHCQLTPFNQSVMTHQQLLRPLKQFLDELSVKRECDYPFT